MTSICQKYYYRKPILACQAKQKRNTAIGNIIKISIIKRNPVKGSGKQKKVIPILNLREIQLSSFESRFSFFGPHKDNILLLNF